MVFCRNLAGLVAYRLLLFLFVFFLVLVPFVGHGLMLLAPYMGRSQIIFGDAGNIRCEIAIHWGRCLFRDCLTAPDCSRDQVLSGPPPVAGVRVQSCNPVAFLTFRWGGMDRT